MSHVLWRRPTDGGAAINQILDAAGASFAEHGVRKATMTDVARAAGCSRATLYRYFSGQEALHLAFVHRATLRIAQQLAATRTTGSAAKPADRILAGVEAVRADPFLAVWFEPANMAVPIAVSQNSELLRAMAAGLAESSGGTDGLVVSPLSPEEIERRGDWLLRCIVSLLVSPGENRERERELIESFVVPVLTARPRQERPA